MSTFLQCMHALLIILCGFLWLGAFIGFFMLRGTFNDEQADGQTFLVAYMVPTWLVLIVYSIGREWLRGKE